MPCAPKASGTGAWLTCSPLLVRVDAKAQFNVTARGGTTPAYSSRNAGRLQIYWATEHRWRKGGKARTVLIGRVRCRRARVLRLGRRRQLAYRQLLVHGLAGRLRGRQGPPGRRGCRCCRRPASVQVATRALRSPTAALLGERVSLPSLPTSYTSDFSQERSPNFALRAFTQEYSPTTRDTSLWRPGTGRATLPSSCENGNEEAQRSC